MTFQLYFSVAGESFEATQLSNACYISILLPLYKLPQI